MAKLKTSRLIVHLKPFFEWQQFDRDLSTSTIAQRRHYLNTFFGWAGDKSWSKETAQGFLRHLAKKGYTLSYRSSFHSTLRIFSKYLYSNHRLDDVMASVTFPWSKHYVEAHRRVPSERRFFSPDEVERLISFREPQRKGRGALTFQPEVENLYNGYFLLLASTGCRRSEALNLKVNDINLTDNTLIFRDTKAGDSRRVPIPPQLAQFLSEHIESYQLKEQNPIFFSVRQLHQKRVLQRLSNTAPELELKRRAKLLRIRKRVHQHMFRHTVATELIKADVSILKVQRILGHHDLRVTQLYTQLVVEDLRDAIFRLPYLTYGEDPEHISRRIQGFLVGLGLQKLSDKGKLDFEIKEMPQELVFKMRW